MTDTTCSGNIYPGYTCFSPFKCCDTEGELKFCFEEGGEICKSSEECVGGTPLRSSDLEIGQVCCADGGSCIEKEEKECEIDDDCYSGETCEEGVCKTEDTDETCEASGGNCRPGLCREDEEREYDLTCNYGDNCCVAKESTNGVWLIILLMILVALVVVGIIFRDRLKVYWLKVKSKFEKGGKGPKRRMPIHPVHPGQKPKKKGFLDKIKEFFKGKKKKHNTPNNMPQRPLRGPLAVQHAQRQAQRQGRPAPSKPEPKKSTTTVFSSGPRVKISKKKVPENSRELDDVLSKLKKIGK